MGDERRKEERSKQGQTNKAKQHSTPKAVTFPKKNELPRVGLEPTTLYALDRALYHMYMYVRIPHISKCITSSTMYMYVMCSLNHLCSGEPQGSVHLPPRYPPHAPRVREEARPLPGLTRTMVSSAHLSSQHYAHV